MIGYMSQGLREDIAAALLDKARQCKRCDGRGRVNHTPYQQRGIKCYRCNGTGYDNRRNT